MSENSIANMDADTFAEFLTVAIGNGSAKKTQLSNSRAILDKLAELGGGQVGEGDIVRGGNKIVLPESVSERSAIKILQQSIESKEKVKEFTKIFNYRPWDGAFVMFKALREVFGSAGFGKDIQTMFGAQKPEEITVRSGLAIDEDGNVVELTEQVPWGQFEFPHLNAIINTSATRDRERGILFQVTFTAPNKMAAQIQGFFVVLEDYLKRYSIYRGKAFDGADQPSFINPYAVDRRTVAYTQTASAQLEANMWAMIRHTDTFMSLGLPLKRAVLVEGPYGTGKTLAAMLTAQEAMEHGWTFIQCRPGKDKLETVLQTAMLYQPAVVFYEDVDTLDAGDPQAISRLLDMFDGITAKGTKLLMVLTTNNVSKIHKGMMRPGRIDAQIRIAALDNQAKEKLIKANVPTELLDENLDFAAIDVAMEGYLPAFIREAIDRAQYYSIARSGGRPAKLTTQDFVLAAEDMRPQYEAMQAASELKPRSTLATAFDDAFTEVVNRAVLVDPNGTPVRAGERLKVDDKG